MSDRTAPSPTPCNPQAMQAAVEEFEARFDVTVDTTLEALAAPRSVGTAVVLEHGDHVLLGLTGDRTTESMAHFRDRLAQSFPDVEFTIVANVAALAVLPATPEETPDV